MSVSITVTNELDRARSDVNNFSPKGDEAILCKNPSVSMCVLEYVCEKERERERLFVCVSRSVMDEEGTRLSPNPHPPNEVYRCLFVIAISGPELSPQDQAPLYLCLTKQDGTTKTTQNIIQPLNPLFFAVIVQCQSQRKLDGKSAN